MRNTPIPPVPDGVAMATMVSGGAADIRGQTPGYLVSPASMRLVITHCWAIDNTLLTTQYNTSPAGKKATGKQVKSQDYTSRGCGTPNKKENPYEETTRDIDEMTDTASRKREFSRRAETSTAGDHNKEHFHETDPENRPPEDTTAFIPDDKKHIKKMRFQYGSGQYDNNPNRGNYEGELR